MITLSSTATLTVLHIHVHVIYVQYDGFHEQYNRTNEWKTDVNFFLLISVHCMYCILNY